MLSLPQKLHIAFMTITAGGFLTALFASDSDAGRLFAFAVLCIGGIGVTFVSRGAPEDDTR